MGLSNISFGLPARGQINRNFLSMAIANGLTTAIVNPFDEELMGLVKASDVLLGKDGHSQEYIRLFSGRTDVIKPKVPAGTGLSAGIADTSIPENITIERKLKNAVLKGNKESISGLIKEALKSGLKAAQILNDYLIPAITEVGELYEKRTYFLPQLMLSAEAMKSAFEILEPILKQDSQEPRGRVVFATVKGDVHDIGKNIVVLMLKDHGFEVIDLGKDVPNEMILEKAKEVKADIVGLSALMTTTMPRMQEFMELLSKDGADIKVMIGGAAVTRAFAENIGAYYSTDAVDAVRAAEHLLSK